MPRIEDDIKLDFKDVLIRPKRSTLKSRSQVSLERTYRLEVIVVYVIFFTDLLAYIIYSLILFLIMDALNYLLIYLPDLSTLTVNGLVYQ